MKFSFVSGFNVTQSKILILVNMYSVIYLLYFRPILCMYLLKFTINIFVK